MRRLGWEINLCGFYFLRFGSAEYGDLCVEVIECHGMFQFVFLLLLVLLMSQMKILSG
jgi:hypothetical protein